LGGFFFFFLIKVIETLLVTYCLQGSRVHLLKVIFIIKLEAAYNYKHLPSFVCLFFRLL
jgi:hypothetical protein